MAGYYDKYSGIAVKPTSDEMGIVRFLWGR